jgi:hypothetical protein
MYIGITIKHGNISMKDDDGTMKHVGVTINCHKTMEVV